MLKFLTGTPGDYTPEQSEGYTLTETPIRAEWAKSGHGDLTAEAWRHWDADGEVPSRCAKCHGPQANDPVPPPYVGFLEYAATSANTLASPLPLGIDCVNCHQTFPTIYSNLAQFGLPDGALEPVTFPSGANLSLYSSSNLCMVCHQGRESGVSVADQIAGQDPPYRFLNIHYYAAAASAFGGESTAGFEYPGMDYKPRNTFPSHPDNFSNCVGCHMKNAEGGEMHTWIPAVDTCTTCHEGSSFETLSGTPSQSFDNLEDLAPELYAAIQDYAANTIGTPIVYDTNRYPYWFDDQGEGYSQFDAKLLGAAYNYQVILKDPAGYVHNGIYLQQIAYDSIEDLGGSTDVEVAGRGDFGIDGSDIGSASKTQQWALSGHAAAAGEPFRHWDGDYEADGYTPAGIPGSCTKCHSTPGFTEYAQDEITTGTAPTTTVDCSSCHQSFNLFADASTRYDDLDANPALENVLFPSGLTASLGNASNICMGCHQGRASTVQVNDAVSNGQNSYPSYDFINIHYYAVGATLFGTDVKGGYEYDGNTYRGQNTFVGLHTEEEESRALVDCIGCHMNSSEDEDSQGKHTFLPEVADCNQCHSGQEFQDLSGSPGDNFREINVLKEDLYAAIQDYAVNGLPTASPVCYDPIAYPYWFQQSSTGDCLASFPNRYRDFDFDMLTAAYNFVTSDKDPAGYIHNGGYIEQLLFDSTCLMGGTPRVVTVPGRPTSCP